MVKYVYYDPITSQIDGIFDTPNLSDQESWVATGRLRALVPEGMEVTRNHRIMSLNGDVIETMSPQQNPAQPGPPVPTALSLLLNKLAADTITPDELRELMRLERGL